MSANCMQSTDSRESNDTESRLEEALEEEVAEEKVADTSSASSNASFSSHAPSSASPAQKAASPIAGAGASELVPEYSAPVNWQPDWNGLVVESNTEYCMPGGDFAGCSGAVVDMETPAMEPCYVPPAQVTPAATHLGPRFVPRPHVHSHPVCPGGALHHPSGTHSPHMHSPGTHSSGSSPYDNGASPAPQQYVVNVHVNPGETFSVRVGDEVQLIQGPATVRMVSNSGPPMPMPMQVPPGHMVQQIVDESGILTHVILSPQIHGVPASPMMAAPSGTPPQMYPPYGPQYPPFPSHFVPHHHPIPPRHFHSMGPARMHGTTPSPPAPHQCNSQNHHVVFDAGSVGPHGSQGGAMDLRAQKIKARLQEKMNKRKAANDSQQRNTAGECHSAATTNINAASAPSTNDKTKSDSCSRDSSVDGQELEEECKLVQELLSKMAPPEVSAIESRCALVRLTPPNITSTDLEIDPSEFVYVVQLSDKKETSFYSDGNVEVPVTKLLPATEYYVRAFCKLDDLQGDPVCSAPFRTLSAEPDAPFAPKMVSKSKTTILLKWSAPADNGSKITSYVLEYDQGTRDLSKFVEIYNGPQKQFKVTKLAPSVGYVFRLAAVNAIGQSAYSDPVCHCTSGTAPSQTDPPMLSEQNVKALTISWIRRPMDDSFTLQMEDEATGHGFLTVYNGSDLSYKVVNLRRNTEYKFRLQACNDEGSSKWSEVVCYRTLPDRPGSPPKPQLKGRASSNSFKVVWDQPKDNGGTEINNYMLQIDDGSKKVHVTNEREFTAEQLQPGFTYRIRVQAVGPGGSSDWSEVLLVTTQAICPSQCRQPRLHGRPKATYLSIMWDCPDYDGGSQVTEYAVLMTNPDQTSSREVYRGHDTECVVAGLLPGRTYEFQVKAVNKAGPGPWSDRLEVVTGAGLPDAPHQPDLHCKSPHIVVVSWDEPSNNGAPITEYRLEWEPKEELDFVPLYCGTSLNYELNRLSPATRYAFRVQAVNSAGVGPFSAVATCLTPPSSPGAVVSLRANPRATSIQLSWKEPPCNGCRITSYNIDIGERHLISVENVTEHIIDSLVPETFYKIRIQAVNAIGVGAFSVPIKVTTRALPPNAPHLECASVGSKFLKLKWGDGKNADLIQYCLEMMKDNGSFQPVYQGTAQTHKVTKLNEQTQYDFRIFATNEAGDGPVSDVFTCATTKAPPGILKQPKVTEIGVNSCMVEWSPLKPIGQDTFIYVLQLQTITDKDQEFHEIYRGAEQSYSVHGLLPKTSYQVRVCAVRKCKDGSDDLVGPFSPASLFTTCSAKSSTLVNESGAAKVQSKLSSIRLTDQQWAILILLGFTLFAVVVAFAAKQIIERTGSVTASRSRN